MAISARKIGKLIAYGTYCAMCAWVGFTVGRVYQAVRDRIEWRDVYV
jgi:hypothetical protein